MNRSKSLSMARVSGLSSFLRRLLVTLALFVGTPRAQTPTPTATPSPSPSVTTELETYVKIVGAGITGVATLLGMPIVFITYRKTRIEISKLELEANALREQQGKRIDQAKEGQGSIRILIDRSPSTTVQVLADPRFLAPLLILLDFIFASIVLTLASHLLSIFSFEGLSNLALSVLAAILLLPIARQVMRVRTVLRPLRTPEEVQVSLRQFKAVAYAVYLIFVLSMLTIGILLLTVSHSSLTDLGQYVAWALVGCSTLMILLAPLGKSRLNRYLIRMHELDIKGRSTET